MKREVSRAIVGVAVLLVIGLGVPLAVVVQRFYQDRAVVELQRRAAETITEITFPLDVRDLDSILREHNSPGPFTLYSREGRRLFGDGPVAADALVERALRGGVVSARSGNELVVAAPLTDRQSETVVGAVRVTESGTDLDREVERAWLVMALVTGVAVLGTAVLARRQATRLATPVSELARQAEELGRGGLRRPGPRSGIDEVDAVSAALSASGERLADTLARERRFSADVAHQLRTPLTGLRLQLERAERENDVAVIPAALAEVARLEATVEHLLTLARDDHSPAATLDTSELLDGLSRRWRARFRAAGRELHVQRDAILPPARGGDVPVSQALDVLVDNGLRHGAGTVSIRARPAAGGLVIEVGDDGEGISADVDPFTRRGNGGGIGLALARSIIEADGGRLLLASTRPARFHVVLPAAEGPIG